MKKYIISFVSAALFSLLSFTGTVFASAPLIFTVPPQPDVVYHHVCDFPVLLHSTGTGIFHVFFDGAGNFDHVIITGANVKLTFTNLDNGKSIWTPSVNMVEEYNNPDGTGVQTLRGLLDHIVIPGQGLVTADVGRIDTLYTFDNSGNIIGAQTIFSAGREDNQFVPAVCTALQ